MNSLAALDALLGRTFGTGPSSRSKSSATPSTALRNRKRQQQQRPVSSDEKPREAVEVPPAILAITEPLETSPHAPSTSKLTFAESPPPPTHNDTSTADVGPSKRRIGLKRELTPKPSMIFNDGAQQDDEDTRSSEDDEASLSGAAASAVVSVSAPSGPVGILAPSPTPSAETLDTSSLLRPSRRRRPSSSTTATSSSTSSASPVLDLGDLPPLRPGAWLGGASVAVLDLWGGLWHSVFGKGGVRPPSGHRRNRRKKRRRSSRRGSTIKDDESTTPPPGDVLDLKRKIQTGEAAEELLVAGAPREPDAEIDDLVDPVTRAPESSGEEVDEAFVPSTPEPEPEPVVAAAAPPARTKLLPNPLSADLLTPSSEKASAGPFGPGKGDSTPGGTDTDSQDSAADRAGGRKRSASILGFTRRTRAPSNASTLTAAPIAPSVARPLPPGVTPFHLRKTLILDLDETLIHSTSRPMSMQSSGMGSGSGLVGINLAALFPGGQRRGGGGGRGEGHTVEVVLGGRSTLYHVYKRPYVDHFLKKVRQESLGDVSVADVPPGLFVVHARHLYGLDARICGPRDRLA